MLRSDPVLQERDGRLVTEGRMLPLPVIEDLDVFKGSGLDFGVSCITNTPYPLILETVEPALCRRVILAATFPARRAGHVVSLELVLKGMAGVLAAQPKWCISPGAGRFLNQAMASARSRYRPSSAVSAPRPTSRLNRSSARAR
jgi:hypothetical protein